MKVEISLDLIKVIKNGFFKRNKPAVDKVGDLTLMCAWSLPNFRDTMLVKTLELEDIVAKKETDLTILPHPAPDNDEQKVENLMHKLEHVLFKTEVGSVSHLHISVLRIDEQGKFSKAVEEALQGGLGFLLGKGLPFGGSDLAEKIFNVPDELIKTLGEADFIIDAGTLATGQITETIRITEKAKKDLEDIYVKNAPVGPSAHLHIPPSKVIKDHIKTKVNGTITLGVETY